MNKIELLAPAGDIDSAKAAILAGANAVFAGLNQYSARKRAKNLSLDELKELLTISHQKNTRVYITMNTLFLQSELNNVVKLIDDIYSLGVDAIIVQDYGLLGILRESFPYVEVHASTQMTTHNSLQIEFLSKLGAKQVNYSRELSLNEIKQLNEVTHKLGLKSEVFVHGAYCISYSGQCYFSSNLYGHSGNKGGCVQPCRRIFSGDSGKSSLPFNLKDNSAYTSIDSIIKAGTDSIKIEGRIKGAEYVYTVIDSFRKQVDSFYNDDEIKQTTEALETVFNRQFTDGYLQNAVSKEMFTQESKDQSYEEIGTVISYTSDSKELQLEAKNLIKDDIIQIKNDEGEFIATGRIKTVLNPGRYKFIIEHKLKGKIYRGQKVFKQPTNRAGVGLQAKINKLVPNISGISIGVTGKLGNKLTVVAKYMGTQCSVSSVSILEESSSKPLSKEIIIEKLGKLGGTDLVLGDVEFYNFDNNLFLPIKELNQLKRELVDFFTTESVSRDSVGLKPYSVREGNAESKVALLVDENSYEELKSSGDYLLFEMPLIINQDIINIFSSNSELIPWFQPILSEKAVEDIKSFILKLEIRNIVTENSGLALWASENSISTILGPHFNITNGYAIKTLGDELHCRDFFLSKELSAEQCLEIDIPQNSNIWFPLFEHQLLMNTKQCLVRNIIPCKKDLIDDDCLLGCSRSAFLKEKQHLEVAVVKRTGFNNQLFNSKMRFNRSEYRSLKDVVNVWMMDFRSIPSKTQFKLSYKETVTKAFSDDVSIFSNIESNKRMPLA